jgi:hypothetical protein
LLVILVAMNCVCCQKQATSTLEPQVQTPPPTLSELLPLKDKTVSSFEMTSDLGEEGMLVLEIFRPRERLVELIIAGRAQRLLIEDTRVSLTSGGILLEEPLEPGHSFQGAFGVTTIVETDATVQVPAGKFERCLTTLEESTRPAKRAQSTYCPQVGLVEMAVETFGEDATILKTRLLNHGPRVDIRDESSLQNLPEN